MAKPEWGVKRLCANCGARFYDLNSDPASCPECGTVFAIEALARTRGRRVAAAYEAKEPAVLDSDELIEDEDALPLDDEDEDAAVVAEDDEAPIEAEIEDDGLETDDVLLEDDVDGEDDLGDFGGEEPGVEEEESR